MTAGNLKVVTGTDPGAGVEWSLTCPTGKFWIVQSVIVTLVADATAVNRDCYIICDTGGGSPVEFCRVNSPGSVTSGTTGVLSWFEGGVAGGGLGTGAALVRALPFGLVIPPGGRMRSSTVNIQAADNYGAPVAQVIEVAGMYDAVHAALGM